MARDRGIPLRGLAAGIGGLGATVGVAASGVRHMGWWLAWHTRARPAEACHPLDDLGASGDDRTRVDEHVA